MSSTTKQLILDQIKTAMKSKDSVTLETLRFLQSAIKYREIEVRPVEISEEEVMGVIKKLIKQRKESIEQYKNASRTDLADKEAVELKILETFLPAQMGAEQVEQLVVQVIAELGAKGPKDMGQVIKAVIAKSQGSADNRLVSEFAKTKLST